MNGGNNKSHQVGVGLVEIMIAMVVGLFLIGGITQIFLSNKQGFRIQEAQSRLQENVRLVSLLLSSGIGKAAFRQNASDNPSILFPATALALSGTNDSGVGALANTDTIAIRFQGDGVMTDCGGSVVAASDISTNTYRVNSSNVLQCRGRDAAAPTATFQSLLDNVDNLQILYGEDVNGDGSVDRYVNAGAVTDFDGVLSVHVAVLLASDEDVKPAANNPTYDLLGTDITMPAAGTDRIQRRVVERVVALRNRLP